MHFNTGILQFHCRVTCRILLSDKAICMLAIINPCSIPRLMQHEAQPQGYKYQYTIVLVSRSQTAFSFIWGEKWSGYARLLSCHINKTILKLYLTSLRYGPLFRFHDRVSGARNQLSQQRFYSSALFYYFYKLQSVH